MEVPSIWINGDHQAHDLSLPGHSTKISGELKMTKRLQGVFNIHSLEGRLVALVLAYAILLFFSNVLVMTASLGLFFETYDAATLPYTYVLLMFVGPLASLVYLRLNSRFNLSRALLGIHTFLLFGQVLLPLLMNLSTAPLLRFSLPVYFELNYTLTRASFWNLLGRLFNLRQGKRLFPFLSSGEHIATIGAGFFATFFVARYGTVNLYWIGALFMAAAIVFLVTIHRANSDKMENFPGADVEQTRPSDLRVLFKEPYVRLLFTMVMLYTISIFMVENLSFAQAEARFPTTDGMATYVGLFMGIYGVLGLLVQWMLAGRILERFGVTATILAMPVGLLMLMSFFALVGSFNEAAVMLFWLASGANMYWYTVDAPYTSAQNVLLQPLPAHLRTQAQTTAMGIAYPLATGVAGLLLLYLLNVRDFNSTQLSYAILTILLLWLFVGLRLGKAYASLLRQALQARSLGGLGLFRSPDRNSISILEEALNSPHPAAVLYALDLLAEVAPEVLPGRLPGLLEYPDDAVCKAALESIAGPSWSAALPGVKALLENSPNPQVRAAALRTWYAVSPQAASVKLAEFGHDPQTMVRQAALAMMRLHDDPALCRQAAETLTDLVESAEPADRIMGAGVIGEIAAGGDDSHLLMTLLEDRNPHVLRAALFAAARAHFPETWPAIIPSLADNRTRPSAVDALVAGGEAVLPLLQAESLEPYQDTRIVAGVALVCGRIRGPKAITILETLLDHTNGHVRHEALLSLSRCDYQEFAQNQGTIKERFRSQAANLAGIVAAQVDVGDAAPTRLTADALEQRRQLETDNLLLLLSFLDDSQTVLSAREALQPGQFDDDRGGYALEAFDILLDHEFKTLLFPFLRQIEPQQRLDETKKLLPQTLLGREKRLIELLAADTWESDRWTRICAIFALGLLEHSEAEERIMESAVRFGDDPVLVEIALNSLLVLGATLEAIAGANPSLEEAVMHWRARDPQAMTLLQKTESLKQASIFANLPNDELEAIASMMDIITVRADETIIHKGDQGDHLYVVIDGQLRVHDGERTFEMLVAGAVAGEMSLLDAEPRSASVTGSSESSRLLQLGQVQFYDWLAGNPQVARELLGLLSKRLRERVADLAPWVGREPVQTVIPVAGTHSGIGSSVVVQGNLLDLDKLIILKGIEFFSGINDDLVGQIAVLLQEMNLAGSETLFQQGDPGRSLYIVVVGQMRVHIEGRTLSYAGEGEVIGEMALLQPEPRSASVTAVVPTQLLRLDQQPFFELLEAQPELARGMIKILSSRLRTRLQELAMHPDQLELPQ
jgi:CRP-like cAMP-binding protein